MPRIRALKPDFFDDEDLAEHPFWVRILFEGLWVNADKAGRLEDRPVRIKAKVFPYDKVNIEDGLDRLALPKKHSPNHHPFIARYDVNGEKYIQILNFDKHQSPHHTEKESEIPPFNGEIMVKEPIQKGNKGDEHSPKSMNLIHESSLIEEVIEYLNKKAGKNFHHGSASSVKFISARANDGRTLDDFKRVVDVKVAAWKGDPKMDAYLRPETLFGSKMEAYLNESIIPVKEDEIQRDRRVGSRVTFESQLTAEAREALPAIDAEFERLCAASADPFKTPDRETFRKKRLAEMFKK